MRQTFSHLYKSTARKSLDAKRSKTPKFCTEIFLPLLTSQIAQRKEEETSADAQPKYEGAKENIIFVLLEKLFNS